MAIVKEKYDGLRQNIVPGKREYDCTFLCRGYTPVASFPSYFRWNSKNASDPFARLTGLGDTRQVGPDLFEVTAHYSTLPYDHRQREADVDPPENPLSRPVRRRWSTGYLEHYPPFDLSATPQAFCVSTGEPIRGGVPVKIPYLIRQYVRNEPFFDEEDCLEKIWTMDATKKKLCTRYEGSETYEDNGVKFVEVTYEFWEVGGTRTWDEQRLDAGSYWLVTVGEGEEAERKPAFLEDAGGAKVFADGAIPLDGAGGRLSDAAIQAREFKWNNFQIFAISNFTQFGLEGL